MSLRFFAASFFVGLLLLLLGGTDCESPSDDDDEDTVSEGDVDSVSLMEQLLPPHCNEHESFFKSPRQP